MILSVLKSTKHSVYLVFVQITIPVYSLKTYNVFTIIIAIIAFSETTRRKWFPAVFINYINYNINMKKLMKHHLIYSRLLFTEYMHNNLKIQFTSDPYIELR